MDLKKKQVKNKLDDSTIYKYTAVEYCLADVTPEDAIEFIHKHADDDSYIEVRIVNEEREEV